MDQKDNETVTVKLITDNRVCIKRNNLEGYCHFSKHKGALTRSLLKKECHYFEKTKTIPMLIQ